MTLCPGFTHLLVLPHLRVQNANAISGPLTHGFPSMTAFLGLMWALERKASKAGLAHLAFSAVGVVCHDWQELVNKGDGFSKRFNLVRQGGSVEYISAEEGRIHLDVSLVFAVYADKWDQSRHATDAQALADLLAGMRIAGGTVVSHPEARSRPWVADIRGDNSAKAFRRLCVRLLPGSALVARDDLIDRRLADLQAEQPHATRLDAWLSLSRTDWHYDESANGGKGRWVSSRQKGDGWIVPIPVGYGALSELHPAGSVRNARDTTTPFRFVESLYSIGEWIGTHHLRAPQDLLWWADSRTDEGVYRCRNGYRPEDPESTMP